MYLVTYWKDTVLLKSLGIGDWGVAAPQVKAPSKGLRCRHCLLRGKRLGIWLNFMWVHLRSSEFPSKVSTIPQFAFFIVSYPRSVPSPMLPGLFSQTHPPTALRCYVKHHESGVPSVQQPGTAAPSLQVPFVPLLLSNGSHSCLFVPVLCLGALIKRPGSEPFGICGMGHILHELH